MLNDFLDNYRGLVQVKGHVNQSSQKYFSAFACIQASHLLLHPSSDICCPTIELGSSEFQSATRGV